MRDDLAKFNVMVTTYETLLSDLDHVGRFRWRLMITDEGHKLKTRINNSETRITTRTTGVTFECNALRLCASCSDLLS